jgi:hypothetical protein
MTKKFPIGRMAPDVESFEQGGYSLSFEGLIYWADIKVWYLYNATHALADSKNYPDFWAKVFDFYDSNGCTEGRQEITAIILGKDED